MKRNFLKLTILTIVLFLNLIGCIIANSQTICEKQLLKGCEIYNDRIKIVEIKETSENKLNIGERLIFSENPNINAVIGSKNNGEYYLKLFSKEGKLITEFKPSSSRIIIPKNKDIVWILGKNNSEGYVSKGKIFYEGLYLYDFKGSLLKVITKEITGSIGDLSILDNGDIICFAKGLKRINSNGEILWSVPIKGDTLQVIGNGKYICSEYFNIVENKREIKILNSTGETIKTFVDDKESYISIVGNSSNLEYIVLRKLICNDPVRYKLLIYDTNSWNKEKKEFEIYGGVRKLLISNKMDKLMILINEREGSTWVNKIKLLDYNGNTMFEYKLHTNINEQDCIFNFNVDMIEIKTPEINIFMEELK